MFYISRTRNLSEDSNKSFLWWVYVVSHWIAVNRGMMMNGSVPVAIKARLGWRPEWSSFVTETQRNAMLWMHWRIWMVLFWCVELWWRRHGPWMENSPSFTTLHAVVTCNYGNFPRQLSKYIIILWAAQLSLSLIGIGQRKKEFT